MDKSTSVHDTSIEDLKKKFGGTVDPLLEIHQIENDLQFLDRVRATKDSLEVFVNPKNPIAMTPGSIVHRAFTERWSEKPIPLRPVIFKGLEQIPGLSSKQIEARYPQPYLEGSVRQIAFNPEPKPLEHNRILLGSVEALSIARMAGAPATENRSPIEIYNAPEGMDAEKFMSVLDHEIHHANDWLNSTTLTSAERINMLYEISERAAAEDRFHSEYVEGISETEAVRRTPRGELPASTSEEQTLAYVLTTEYWPEIARAYLEDKEKFKEEHPEDAALVEKWMGIQSAKSPEKTPAEKH